MSAAPVIVALARDGGHRFSKHPVPDLTLIAGQGVLGDAHCGVTVKHRSRVARDPSQPNLRQVHLIGAELLDEVTAKGLPVAPGEMGENVTLRGLDLLSLPRGADGQVIRRAGVMAIVLNGGVVHVGDTVRAILPAPPLQPLIPV